MNKFKEWIPESVRQRVRNSGPWRKRYHRRHALDLAAGSKRLDLCAAQVAHMLHLSGHPPLRGKVCLEVGCGWILTHALVFHLLGVKKVIASDIEAMARPAYLTHAISQATPYIVRDVLSPFCDHSEIRARLENLRSLEHFDLEVLASLGIEYRAPIDLARETLGTPVDFIYSLSVLEHVPVDDISGLLRNLAMDLRPGGAMLHAIHLEDHRDIEQSPFPFLAEPEATYGRREQTDHGNRVRRSRWHREFNSVADLEARFIYQFARQDKPLPEVIDPSVTHEGEEDLRVSHVGVYAFKGGRGVET